MAECMKLPDIEDDEDEKGISIKINKVTRIRLNSDKT